MKSLISLMSFIMLFSCGKTTKTDSSVYLDDDGDQIVNRDEQTIKDKLTANIIPLEKIEGEIEFYEGISKLKKHKIQFSNELNLQEYSLNLLLKNRVILNLENHFSEFTSLKANLDTPISLNDQKEFNVNIRFKTIKSFPNKIYLIKKKEIISTYEWSKELSIPISRENLLLFMEGKASFSLSYLHENLPTFSESRSSTIQSKTYRIFFNDGAKTQVFYISKKLTLIEVFIFFKINQASNIDDINLFHSADGQNISKWWVRILNQDDLVFVFDHEAKLKRHFLNLFDIRKQALVRKNGYPQNSLHFIKSPYARMYLEFTGVKTKLSFDTRKRTHKSGGGHQGSYDRCDYYETFISKEDHHFIQTLDFIEGLNFKTDGSETEHQLQLKESDSLWEVEVPAGIQEISIYLRNIDKSLYKKTGVTKSDCLPLKMTDTATEGMLNLEVKSYVEKI